MWGLLASGGSAPGDCVEPVVPAVDVGGALFNRPQECGIIVVESHEAGGFELGNRLVLDFAAHPWQGRPELPKGEQCAATEERLQGAEDCERRHGRVMDPRLQPSQ